MIMSRRTAATSSCRFPRTICFLPPVSGTVAAAVLASVLASILARDERSRGTEAVEDLFMSVMVGGCSAASVAVKMEPESDVRQNAVRYRRAQRPNHRPRGIFA